MNNCNWLAHRNYKLVCLVIIKWLNAGIDLNKTLKYFYRYICFFFAIRIILPQSNHLRYNVCTLLKHTFYEALPQHIVLEFYSLHNDHLASSAQSSIGRPVVISNWIPMFIFLCIFTGTKVIIKSNTVHRGVPAVFCHNSLDKQELAFKEFSSSQWWM